MFAMWSQTQLLACLMPDNSDSPLLRNRHSSANQCHSLGLCATLAATQERILDVCRESPSFFVGLGGWLTLMVWANVALTSHSPAVNKRFTSCAPEQLFSTSLMNDECTNYDNNALVARQWDWLTVKSQTRAYACNPCIRQFDKGTRIAMPRCW